MTHLQRVLTLIALGLAALGNTSPAYAAADQVEIAIWHSAEASKNPSDYQLYLDMYPDGAFAPLALGRLQAAAGAPRPIALPNRAAPLALAAVPDQDTDPSDPAVTVSPTSGRVGQLFTLGCVNLPENRLSRRDHHSARRHAGPAAGCEF